MTLPDHLFLLAIAVAVDALAGDPALLWQRIPHPIVLIGRLIGHLDRRLNRPADTPERQRTNGIFMLGVVAVSAALAGGLIEWVFSLIPFGSAGTIIVAAVLLAGRNLHDHVRDVVTAFGALGLDGARAAVSRIVGRDPDTLDEAGVCRAAIESTAENFSDGVVAPALWFALFGLPGLFAYKAINTADSMVGHKSAQYLHFGWASARLDDLVNWPAARFSALLIAFAAPLGGGAIGRAWHTAIADARKHRSPNAGWPEAAMAGALDLALAGPRTYGGEVVVDSFLNADGRQEAAPADITRGLRVYAGAWMLLFAVALALGLLLAG